MPLRGSSALVGFGETPVNRDRFSGTSLTLEEYAAKSVELALKDAGLEKKDIDGQGVVVNRTYHRTSMGWGAGMCERLGLSPKWQICVDHGGMNSSAGIMQATLAINAGIIDIALIVGAETPLSIGPAAAKGPNNDYLARDFQDPFGLQGPNSSFALVLRRHMYQYGTKFEQLGKIAVVQREHACLNPMAFFYGKPITLEDYMNSRWVAEPIRLLDCVMPCNGGMACIITSSKKAKELTDKPVYVLGFGEYDNYYAGGSRIKPDITQMSFGLAAEQAFRMSGTRLRDMQFLQLYDDYTIAVLMTLESLGYCKVGEGGKFVEKTDISFRGELPINTGGGQLSAGQPVGAACGGMKMYGEAFHQLRGEANQRQIKGAKIGLCTGIGMLTHGRNVTNTGVVVLGSEV